MDNPKYSQVLLFLKKYGGEKYKMIKKCKSDKEKAYMEEGAELGKRARASFEEIINEIQKRFGLKPGKITQWQNSGSFVRYLWCQLKDSKYLQNNISLSVFAENAKNDLRYRVSVELAVEKASASEIENYRSILDLPLKENLVYVSGGNNESVFEVLSVHNNEEVKRLNLKKVQVSFIVPLDGYNNDDGLLLRLLSGGTSLLFDYYYHAIGKNGNPSTGGNRLTDEQFDDPKKPTPEEIDALNDFSMTLSHYNDIDAHVILSTKEIVEHIKDYFFSRGFIYSYNLIVNFYLSLKSKPFVILAGTSGTGKTKLVELFAEAIGAEYSLVSVRPDWSDGSDLFGHHDLNGNFIEGPVCEAFDKAIAEPDRPVLLCLDEMNLARVEYYLSDFLSVIESRKKGDDGTIKTKPIAQYAEGIPDNLYFVGTVNMDETTFPFSKKVLDRANTIEFNYVELLPDFDTADSEQEALNVPNSFLKTEYLVLALDCADEKEFVTEVCGELQKINVILREANAHVGYRVRDEIVFYMLNNKKAGNLLTEDEAMDNEIMQKILPRIQGSSVAIRDMLVKLFKFCMGNQSGPDTDSGKAGQQMQGMADSAKYKESARKIGYMMTRYEDDGFTSYWL